MAESDDAAGEAFEERRERRRWLPSLESPWLGPAFGALAAVLVWGMAVLVPGPLVQAELLIHRLWIQRRGVEDLGEAEPDIVLVTLTERCNAYVQERWGDAPGQWSRERWADVVGLLRELGAAAVGVDLVMDHAREGTAALARVLAAEDDTVLAAYRQRAAVASKRGWRGSQHELRKPVDALAARSRLGHINLVPDRDAVVRKGSLYLFARDLETLPSLDLQLRRILTGREGTAEAPTWGEVYWPATRELAGFTRPVPLLAESEFLIRYKGPSPAFPEVPVHKLLDPVERRRMFYTPSLPPEGVGAPLSVELSPAGTRTLRLEVTPRAAEVQVLALPEEGGGPWAAGRVVSGEVALEGLAPGTHQLFVARRLGAGAWGVGSVAGVRSVEDAPVALDLPEPAGVIEGRVEGAAPGARVRLRSIGLDAPPAWGDYYEVLDLPVEADGRFRSPPVASRDFLVVTPGAARAPVVRGEPAALPAEAAALPAPGRTLEVAGLEVGDRVAVIDRQLPLPPYLPAPVGAEGTLDVPENRAGGDLRALVTREGGARRGGVLRVHKDLFDGAVVLIGSTIEVEQDFHATPFDYRLFDSGREAALRNRTPGVEIHAHSVRTLLTERFVASPTGVATMGEPDLTLRLGTQLPLLPFLLLVCVPGGWLLRKGMPGWSGRLLLGMLVALQQGTYGLLASGDAWVHTATPAAALVATYVGLLAYNYAIAEKRRQLIRNAFEHYLDPDIVQELTKNPRALELGGKQQVVTCFFSDIEGFSTFSEAMTPPELVEFINEYLTALSDVLLKYGGWIDKFIGDAIVGVYNAPRSQPDHARRCVMAALEIRDKEAHLRKVWGGRGLPEVRTRIGINTGTAVVGNVGTSDRKNYTILGDAVNLAARLEALNKSYGTYLMVGEETWAEIREDFAGRELDRVRVKGKTVPASVVEVLALRGELPERWEAALPRWEAGLAAYRDQDWDAATKAFEEVRDLLEGDGPSETYLRRITLLRDRPPGEGWDGVWTMEHK